MGTIERESIKIVLLSKSDCPKIAEMERSQASERRPNRSKSRAQSAKNRNSPSFAQRAVVREHSENRSESRNSSQNSHLSSADSAVFKNIAGSLGKLAKKFKSLDTEAGKKRKSIEKSSHNELEFLKRKI